MHLSLSPIPLFVKQKPQKRLAHNNSILRQDHSLHRTLKGWVIKDTGRMPRFQDLSHDLLVELWMALDGQQSFRHIHSLYLAESIRAERLDPRWVVEDDISMHELQALSQVSA